jgi:hypothetical protein
VFVVTGTGTSATAMLEVFSNIEDTGLKVRRVFFFCHFSSVILGHRNGHFQIQLGTEKKPITPMMIGL